MRIVLSISFLLCMLLSSAQRVSSLTHDFGKIKMWNNPEAEFTYTNTSGKVQQFLPIQYSPQVSVYVADMKLNPGESTLIKLKYYTEEFGSFSEKVPLYISTQGDPLIFSLRGNIKSFHPEAFSLCPRIDNSELQLGSTFLYTVKVVDEITGEPLDDYEILIKTRSSKETIQSETSFHTFSRERPELIVLTIDKEDYEVYTTDIYVNRNTRETIIPLKREIQDKKEEEETYDWEQRDSVPVVSDTPEVVVKEEPLDTHSTLPDPIQEEEVVVDNEPLVDSIPPIVVMEVPTPDTSDYQVDGKLNTDKYAYNHIVFLIDVSTSMKNDEKMPLLKKSMLAMITVLRPEDKVSIITYSTSATVLVDGVSGAEKVLLTEEINKLVAKGQSYGTEGVDMAYKLAQNNLIVEGNNEIILASDGVFNSRNFNENRLYRKAMLRYAAYDVRLSTIGFGKTKKALTFLEKLSEKGNGSFLLIKDGDANEVLIANLMKHSRK